MRRMWASKFVSLSRFSGAEYGEATLECLQLSWYFPSSQLTGKAKFQMQCWRMLRVPALVGGFMKQKILRSFMAAPLLVAMSLPAQTFHPALAPPTGAHHAYIMAAAY